MEIRLRGRSRDNGKDLFYYNAIPAIYHSAKTRLLIGFAGYDKTTKKPVMLDIEMDTGFIDANGAKIWEHDTIKWADSVIYTVVWWPERGCWAAETDNTLIPLYELEPEHIINCDAHLGG